MAQDVGTDTAEQRRASTAADLRALLARTLTVAASVIRLLCVLFAAVLVIHVLFFVIPVTNRDNPIVQFFNETANVLAPGFIRLFAPVSEELSVILNFGFAAIVWIVVGVLVSKLLSRLAPR